MCSSDLVLVLKKNGTWRMCVDYTSLNKACPKDPFALPRIDQVIDSTAGCDLLLFLDAYSGYHQIKLNPADQIKTAFITPYGAFCYTNMPFGLKNAGATYQRCMQMCLHDQIGRNCPLARGSDTRLEPTSTTSSSRPRSSACSSTTTKGPSPSYAGSR